MKKTHGHSHGSTTYRSWAHMKMRCLNKNAPNYARYGGAGISICARWMFFENFLEDMGLRPEGTSIDRVDSHGNYEPSNCRWATNLKQSNNKKATKFLEIDGRRLGVGEWARIFGIKYQVLRNRVNANWPIDRLFSKADWRKEKFRQA